MASDARESFPNPLQVVFLGFVLANLISFIYHCLLGLSRSW